MGIAVEFEAEGRTYRVDTGLHEWNIHGLNRLREKVVFTTDLLTGDELFLAWSQTTVLRRVTQG